MHDQLIDKQSGSSVKVYANTATRDADLPTPTNGMSCYVTADWAFNDYVAWAWVTRANGAVVNASETVAGKVEIATDTEVISLTDTWATGAFLVPTLSQFGWYYSFWDGSDGDVIISSNTSLTRDMYYNNLTVNTWIELNPAWYAIYVLWTLTLTWTAKIVRNWNTWGNSTASTGWTWATALATWTCWTCLWWATWANGWTWAGTNGTAWTAVNPSYATTATASAAWGNGGAWASWGGTGGVTAAATRGTLYNTTFSLSRILSYFVSPSRWFPSPTQYWGLPSGGSGASWGGNGGGNIGWGGGGSGWNGGIIFIYANILTWSGTIEARWGNGGNGWNSSWAGSWGGGGGAWGSGGTVVIVYKSGTPWTMTLTGGTGWSPWTSSSWTATAWGNWTVWQSIIINV